MPLNDRQIKAAKPSDTGKKAKLFDGGGLYLEVTPAGGKVFRLKYRFAGKEKTLTIGKYPAFSLVEARQAAENARRMIAQGQDRFRYDDKDGNGTFICSHYNNGAGDGFGLVTGRAIRREQ